MSGSRDGLLDEWTWQHKRLAVIEANLTLACDLLYEAIDEIDPRRHPRLHTAIRSFLLNVPVGGR